MITTGVPSSAIATGRSQPAIINAINTTAPPETPPRLFLRMRLPTPARPLPPAGIKTVIRRHPFRSCGLMRRPTQGDHLPHVRPEQSWGALARVGRRIAVATPSDVPAHPVPRPGHMCTVIPAKRAFLVTAGVAVLSMAGVPGVFPTAQAEQYVRTASGKMRCEVEPNRVGCQNALGFPRRRSILR